MYNGFEIRHYDGVCNVDFNFNTYFDMLVNKCCNLFKWENLPETVDERYLNMSLVLSGKVCWTEFNDKLYVATGNWGGEPNAYYEPTIFTIANPVLGSKQVKIRNKDGSEDIENLTGILMANSDVDAESDRGVGGLYGLIYQTAGLLADNISSLNVAQINSRVALLFTADSRAEAETGEKVLQDIYSGKPYKILAQNIVEKFGINPVASSSSSSQTLMNLMEVHQYLLAQFYNELGINSSFNMKRERLNTAEVEQSTGCLDINIWNMLKNRQEACERINAKYGTNISVNLNEDIFYLNSGNATLGEENGAIEDVQEDVREDISNDSGDNSVATVSEEETVQEEAVPAEEPAPTSDETAPAAEELAEVLTEVITDVVEDVIEEKEVETNES